nr:uncharacterized protein CTRU02_06141 [Colletotrichum truncatum]KAF6793269.1 hypothetical protein CTRU02_06141 [Colletotrichum truncatum]
MFGILGAVNVDSNTKTYSSFEDLFAALKARMQKDGYKVVKSRTHRNKVGGTYEKGSEVVRCDLVCDRGGQPYKCTATQLKTTTKKTDCPWKAKAVNRKTMGAWLLTIICDEHNHEPRTPDPPTDEEDADAEGDADVQDTSAIVPEQDNSIPTPDPMTSAALAVAGVSSSQMRLTGDTFHNFKAEYRKMTKPERIGVLAQLQLRVAALYAIENEDLQRQERQARQERKHQEIEDTRRKSQSSQQTQQPLQQAQGQPQQQQQQQQQQHHPQAQQHQPQHQTHQPHQQHQQPQAQNHTHNHNHTHTHNHNHNRAAQQQMNQMSRDSMAGMQKHPFEQSGHDEHAQYRDRQAEVGNRHQNFMNMAREHMGNAVQQTPVQQTPIPVPQFGMQPTPGPNSANVFRHYSGTPTNNTGAPAGGGTPATGQQKRRGRPKKSGMDQQSLDASLHMGR